MDERIGALETAIGREFDEKVAVDPIIRGINKKIDSGTAEMEDAFHYTQRIAEHASEALINGLQSKNLPDGRLRWNIANEIVGSLIARAHKMINATAIAVQLIQDERIGIGIRPIASEFPEARLYALINKLVNTIDAEVTGDAGT